MCSTNLSMAALPLIQSWILPFRSSGRVRIVSPERQGVTLRLSFTDPCLNHHCKKGKVCEVDESNTPMCVCQDPTACPAADGEFEHVSVKNPTACSNSETITCLPVTDQLKKELMCLDDVNVQLIYQYRWSWKKSGNKRSNKSRVILHWMCKFKFLHLKITGEKF